MKALYEFLEVIANEEFVEGHEVLEVPWKAWKRLPEKEAEARILKGLINGATALALKRKGRHDPALRVWKTYEKYRPLIGTTPSAHTALYKAAQVLLEEKYALVFAH